MTDSSDRVYESICNLPDAPNFNGQFGLKGSKKDFGVITRQKPRKFLILLNMVSDMRGIGSTIWAKNIVRYQGGLHLSLASDIESESRVPRLRPSPDTRGAAPLALRPFPTKIAIRITHNPMSLTRRAKEPISRGSSRRLHRAQYHIGTKRIMV